MDPRRVVLGRRQIREMGLLTAILASHPYVESEVNDAHMTTDEEAAWSVFSALADQIEAERRRP